MVNTSIVAIYERVSQLTKSGTSGYIDQDEFNGMIDSKQKSLLTMLIDVEGENKKAAELINWLKSEAILTADTTGIITFPDDYFWFRTISLKVGTLLFPVTILQDDQIDMTRTSPIRQPNIANNNVYAYFSGGNLTMMPEQAMQTRLRYYMEPPVASITLTESGDDDGDYLTPTENVALGWPDTAFNLLTYMVLMDYGVEMKEQEIFEFAQYGITIEMVKKAAA